jgi:hypothetical protein
MADKLEDLSYFDFALLYFTDENKDQTKKIINDYIYGGAAEGNFTRGLYYRNIL